MLYDHHHVPLLIPKFKSRRGGHTAAGGQSIFLEGKLPREVFSGFRTLGIFKDVKIIFQVQTEALP